MTDDLVTTRNRCVEQIQTLETLFAVLHDRAIDRSTLNSAWIILGDTVRKLESILQDATWPQPTVDPPSLEDLELWMMESGSCQASDGCEVEMDGVCPHGHPSWLIRWSFI